MNAQNNILVLGAGRSSVFLIDYLAGYGAKKDYQLVVCDKDTTLLKKLFAEKEYSNMEIRKLDIFDLVAVNALVQSAAVVVSLLPAFLHIQVAQVCLAHGRHLATASYVSDEMKALEPEVKARGLIFLNEIGLDPGLDHLSAMQVIDTIKTEGGVLTGFESYCGGLVTDESDGGNPWKYKFTWNPRNVVLAGQGGPAKFLHNGHYKYIPYHRLFRRSDLITLSDGSAYEGYANRDSLKYLDVYRLQGVKTMYRGTLRKTGYCKAWDIFVQLGMNDDSYVIADSHEMSYRQFTESFLPEENGSIEERLARYCHADEEDVAKIKWLGLFENNTLVQVKNGTPAAILEELLKRKWALEAGDKDLVVMYHKFTYMLNGTEHHRHSSLVVEGDNETYTAMAKTVGLPLAMGVKLILENRIRERGVIIPVQAEFYEPVLEELKQYNIIFTES